MTRETFLLRSRKGFWQLKKRFRFFESFQEKGSGKGLVMRTLFVKASDKDSIELAVEVLRRGGVVVYPTETAYGLGADIAKVRGVAKIYKVKKRPRDKRLSVIFGSFAAAQEHVFLNDEAKALCRKFMPGPLTLVSDLKPTSPVRKRLFYHDLAWRIPSHGWARRLAMSFGGPVSATSANISARPPIYSVAEAEAVFDGKVDLIVDGGGLKPRRPSTIFDTRTLKVLRKGPVGEKEIRRILRL